jgi:MazG family protein
MSRQDAGAPSPNRMDAANTGDPRRTTADERRPDPLAAPPSQPAREAAEWFARLVDVVATLRSPGGCPWDREQTLASLRPFVLEEAYEVLETIDAGNFDALRGEIGDFLFEGVLLAQLTAETGRFTVRDSLRDIVEKLIRRHPHVFGTARRAESAHEVLGRWEELKARERQQAGTQEKWILSGVPKTLPALLRAFEMGNRAAAVKFDWERTPDVLAKIEEEVGEIGEVMSQPDIDRGRLEEEMGDLLFAIANLSRKLGVEPEAALRRADNKFASRFTELERRFRARGRSLQDATLEEMEAEWGRIKDDEHGREEGKGRR